MKKSIGLVIVMLTVMLAGGWGAATAADMGMYVTPKMMFDVSQGNYLSHNGSNSNTYKYTNNMGGALAVGYDFSTVFDVPVRTELEYGIRSNANFNYDHKNVRAMHPQSLFGNVYYDFKNSTAFTPYVGGGLGMAFIGDNSTNFAWNVGGGVAYEFAQDWKLDVGYRYVDLGRFDSKHCNAKYTAHEFMTGLRYTF